MWAALASQCAALGCATSDATFPCMRGQAHDIDVCVCERARARFLCYINLYDIETCCIDILCPPRAGPPSQTSSFSNESAKSGRDPKIQRQRLGHLGGGTVRLCGPWTAPNAGSRLRSQHPQIGGYCRSHRRLFRGTCRSREYADIVVAVGRWRSTISSIAFPSFVSERLSSVTSLCKRRWHGSIGQTRPAASPDVLETSQQQAPTKFAHVGGRASADARGPHAAVPANFLSLCYACVLLSPPAAGRGQHAAATWARGWFWAAAVSVLFVCPPRLVLPRGPPRPRLSAFF